MGSEPVGALQQPSKAPVHGAHAVTHRGHWPQRLALVDRVPDVLPRCDCGWPKQTTRHVVMHCPTYQQQRAELVRETGFEDFRAILTGLTGEIPQSQTRPHQVDSSIQVHSPHAF